MGIKYRESEHVPPTAWGKDHWSTLAYVETVIVDCASFECGADPRMRSNRRNFRVMNEQNPRPLRAVQNRGWSEVMLPEHTSRLKLGAETVNHDDWCCLQDMVAAGLFEGDVEPGVHLKLTPVGVAVCAALRRHKQDGGTFSNFDPSSVAHLAWAALGR